MLVYCAYWLPRHSICSPGPQDVGPLRVLVAQTDYSVNCLSWSPRHARSFTHPQAPPATHSGAKTRSSMPCHLPRQSCTPSASYFAHPSLIDTSHATCYSPRRVRPHWPPSIRSINRVYRFPGHTRPRGPPTTRVSHVPVILEALTPPLRRRKCCSGITPGAEPPSQRRQNARRLLGTHR